MKAAVYYDNGGPEVFKYEDVPDPECPPGWVVILLVAIVLEDAEYADFHDSCSSKNGGNSDRFLDGR